MSKKNSSAILKNKFKDHEDLSSIYQKFKDKLDALRKKKFVIAISGGPDSLALAALSKAYSNNSKSKFFYVLVNHNIRKNSAKEAIQVKSLLNKRKISLNILSNKSTIKRNIQGQARDIRYNLLANFCKKKNVSTILTAHNLEDQVETFFIRLSRGSGLTGLSAMSDLTNLNKGIKLFRPMLDIKKKYLIKISKYVFGSYFKDPSNQNLKYLRTKIRNLKIPLRDSGISYDQIIKSIKNLASSKDVLSEYYQKVFKNIVKKNKGEILINLKNFKKLNIDFKIKIINDSIKILKSNYYNPRSKKVIYLINIFQSKSFKKATLGGCIFLIKKDHLCLKSEKK